MVQNKLNLQVRGSRRPQRLVGLGVSRGVGKGNVVFLPTGGKPQFRSHLTPKDIEIEIARFRDAVEKARERLRRLANETDSDDHRVSEIFSFHQLILDSSIAEKAESLIKDQCVNAEGAIDSVLGEYASKQASLEDEHFREKRLDIEDVAGHLKRALRGTRTPVRLDPDSVVVAHELRPSAVVELAKYKPAGLITEIGGWTSHMSIVAREFHLPMVTGIKNVGKILAAGDVVVVDGNAGEVLLDVEDTYNGEIGNIRAIDDAEPELQVKTIDGDEIVIRANAEDPVIYQIAEARGARGVGLYRSELLISDDNIIPGEDEQYEAYCEMARATGRFGVAVRTFDIPPEHLTNNNGRDRNPALGLRGIRSGMSDPDTFKSQIRAILRASATERTDIILPMISNLEELGWAKNTISATAQDLEAKGVKVGSPRVGIMVEVPSTILSIRELAGHVDFLCLGTNDLVQYLLAVDRDNDAVADWYQTLNPAVLKAIRMVIEASTETGVPVTVCGEMAASPFYVPVLVGLGARELSLNTNSIRSVIKLVSGISTAEAEALVNRLASCATAAEAEELLKEHYNRYWKELFPGGLLAAEHR